MNEKLFQDIFDKLQEVLPEGWSRIAFYAGYTKGSYSMKYYVDDGCGEYIDCFSLNSVNKAKNIHLFVSIDKIISQARGKLDEKNKWNVLSMFINSNGKINANFDYTDISENSIEYEQEWKKRYL